MSESAPRTPRRQLLRHGDRKRLQILRAAVDLGSAEGLDGLSIARLARETGLSKSGLFAHFGSKEDLQLAAIDAAAATFENAVMQPALAAPPGLARLREQLHCWIAHVAETPNRGGCFFFATSSEFGSRPGPVRDRLAAVTRLWVHALESEARTAQRQREIDADIDPRQLAFEFHAFVQEANWMRELHDDAGAFDRARHAIGQRLGQVALEPQT